MKYTNIIMLCVGKERERGAATLLYSPLFHSFVGLSLSLWRIEEREKGGMEEIRKEGSEEKL